MQSAWDERINLRGTTRHLPPSRDGGLSDLKKGTKSLQLQVRALTGTLALTGPGSTYSDRILSASSSEASSTGANTGTGSHPPPALSARAACLLLFVITFPVCKNIGYRITSQWEVVKGYFVPGFAAGGQTPGLPQPRAARQSPAPTRPVFPKGPLDCAATWSCRAP